MTTGTALRIGGPLLQVVGMALLLRHRGEGRTLAGVSLDAILYATVLIGFGMVLSGLALRRREHSRARRERDGS